MKDTAINKIKNLLVSLPASDIALGEKFLKKRDFESLQFLVDSAIIRTKKGLSKDVVKQEYLDADMEGMKQLQVEVNDYCVGLELPIDNLEEDY